MDVVAHIYELLDARGWSVYRLKKESGLPQSTLSNFSRGTVPSISTLETICKALGITLSQFFAEAGEPVILTPNQRKFLDRLNCLSPEKQAALLQFMDQM